MKQLEQIKLKTFDNEYRSIASIFQLMVFLDKGR